MPYDLVIRGGTIIDGTGMPGYTADLALADGHIARIGRIAEPARARSMRGA
jgi:N-acyl-D-aspartate/D-glutamate deacylase